MAIPDGEARAILALIKAQRPVNAPTDALQLATVWRAQVAALGAISPLSPSQCSVTDHVWSCSALRLYRPSRSRLPVILFFHGGFVAGSIDDYDSAARTIAAQTGWAVASVDYGLAPEHSFPAASEDCFAALRMLQREAPNLGLDEDGIVLAGDSAGGLLAIVTALMAREQHAPRPRALICLYPNTDLRNSTRYTSRTTNDGRFLQVADLFKILDLYLRGADRDCPFVSPILADLRDLPRSLVVTCEFDPLRDEGAEFTRRLEECDVEVVGLELKGALHGVLSLRDLAPDAAGAMFDGLREFLGPPDGAWTPGSRSRFSAAAHSLPAGTRG